MSDILFDPKNISSKIPRDVLNIIGTYVQHPIAEIIREISYQTNNFDSTRIAFKNKIFTYTEHCLNSDDLYLTHYKYKLMFDVHIFSGDISPNISINVSKFEIYHTAENGKSSHRLKNIVPMHCDTFFMMHRYIVNIWIKFRRSLNIKK